MTAAVGTGLSPRLSYPMSFYFSFKSDHLSELQSKQGPVPMSHGWYDLCTKNNSITSDFWIISGVVLQIFCIFLVSLSTFYYLCGINTFIYVRENIKIARN